MSTIDVVLQPSERIFVKAAKKYFVMKAGLAVSEQKCGNSATINSNMEKIYIQMVDSFDFDTNEDREKLVMPNEGFPRSCAYDELKVAIKRVQQKTKTGNETPPVGETLWKTYKNVFSTLRNGWVPYVEEKSGNNEESMLERATIKAFFHKKANAGKDPGLAQSQLEIPVFRAFYNHPTLKATRKDDEVISGEQMKDGSKSSLIKDNIKNRMVQRKEAAKEAKKRTRDEAVARNEAHIQSSQAKKMKGEAAIRHANALESRNQLDFLKFAKETGMNPRRFASLMDRATEYFFPTENSNNTEEGVINIDDDNESEEYKQGSDVEDNADDETILEDDCS